MSGKQEDISPAEMLLFLWRQFGARCKFALAAFLPAVARQTRAATTQLAVRVNTEAIVVFSLP